MRDVPWRAVTSRRLPPFPLALVTALAMFPLSEEQPVHELAGPVPHPVPRPTVTARGQGFVRPAAEERIEELVDGDQRSFSVGHAASTSSGVVAASTAALRSPPRCIAPFLCFMAPPT